MSHPSPATLRTFIAIETPVHLHTPIRRVQTALASALDAPATSSLLNWTEPEKVHLTLRFLGDTRPAHVEQLAATLAAALRELPHFTLQLGGVGCFPQPRKPRVIWLGIEPTDPDALTQLNRLQSIIEQAATAIGYTPETRPFRPHFTLARVNRRATSAQIARLGEHWLAAASGPARGLFHSPIGDPWTVTEILHFQSDLTRGGPIYTPLSRIPFASIPLSS